MTSPRSWWTKIVKKGVFILIPALLMLGVAEGALRIYNYSTRTPYFEEGAADGSTMVRFKGGLIEYEFSARKAPGTFRVFFLGASSVQGYQWVRYSTIPLRLERMLKDGFPDGPDFEVVNFGVMGATSREVLEILRQSLRYDSDLYVLYLGHNELGIGLAPNLLRNTPLRSQSQWLLEHSALYKVTINAALLLVAGKELNRPSVTLEVGDDLGIFFTGRARSLGAGIFRRNLASMAAAAAGQGRQLLFTTVIGNEADHPPAKSVMVSAQDDEARAEIQSKTAMAEKLVVDGQASQARDLLAGVLAREPSFARAHFLMGRVRLAEDRPEEARQEFILARDLDDFPVRATTVINETIRGVGRQKGVPVLDVERDLKNQGIAFDRSLFHDHVHLTLQGQQQVAESIHDYIVRMDGWPQPGGTRPRAPGLDVINRELKVPPYAKYHLNMSQAFFVGGLSNRPFYGALALYCLDEAERDADDPWLVKMARGFLRLKNGPDLKALEDWRPLLEGDAKRFELAADQFFDGDVIFLRDQILVDTNDQRSQFYDYPSNLAKKPSLHSVLEVPADRDFLARFEVVLKWSQSGATLTDFTAPAKGLLEAREKIFAADSGRHREEVNIASPLSLAGVKISGCQRLAGTDSCLTTDNDPWILPPPMAINALTVGFIDILMKVEGGGAAVVMAELYWRGSGGGSFSERSKIVFPVEIGVEKTYRLPVGNLLDWLQSGSISRLRLDPGDIPGLTVTVKSIRIMPY